MNKYIALQALCSNGFNPRGTGITLKLGAGRTLHIGADILTAKRPGARRSFGLGEIHFAIGFLNGKGGRI
jgi:hypothetical protein